MHYEEMFGWVFLALLAGSTFYAVGRYIYEAWVKKPAPSADPNQTGIPFHKAVRLAGEVFQERFNRERDTVVMVLPRNPDGSLADPEAPASPGARTVDVQDRTVGGRHRAGYIGTAAVVSRIPEPA